MRVLKHVTEDIIVINLIHKQHLFYDPINLDIFFSSDNRNSVISIISEVFMPAQTKKIIKWLCPATLVEVNESVAKIKLNNNRQKPSMSRDSNILS